MLMLSSKTRYAIVALAKLAKEYGKGPVFMTDIAESTLIPKPYLSTILQELKTMGIISSRSGKQGGYYLIRKPEEVTLEEIINYFEGPVGVISCMAHKEKPCEQCMHGDFCMIQNVYKEVMNNTMAIFRRTTIDKIGNGV